MNLSDARRHADHLCDVYPTDENVEHIGVMESVRIVKGKWSALVSGHPEYAAKWFPIVELSTSCKITD